MFMKTLYLWNKQHVNGNWSKDFVSPRKKRNMAHFSESETLMIINVFKYVKESWPADKYPSKQEMKDKTADILGISKSAVYRILNKYTKTATVKPAAAPKKRMSIIEKIDDFDKSCIRKIVHSFYLKGELPTAKKVLQVVNADESLPSMEQGRPIYYLDETWVNAGHTVGKVWEDTTVKSRKQAFLEVFECKGETSSEESSSSDTTESDTD
ncbi:hypothetical protein ACJJTC_006841 [Scirpophaga incertulas]